MNRIKLSKLSSGVSTLALVAAFAAALPSGAFAQASCDTTGSTINCQGNGGSNPNTPYLPIVNTTDKTYVKIIDSNVGVDANGDSFFNSGAIGPSGSETGVSEDGTQAWGSLIILSSNLSGDVTINGPVTYNGSVPTVEAAATTTDWSEEGVTDVIGDLNFILGASSAAPVGLQSYGPPSSSLNYQAPDYTVALNPALLDYNGDNENDGSDLSSSQGPLTQGSAELVNDLASLITGGFGQVSATADPTAGLFARSTSAAGGVAIVNSNISGNLVVNSSITSSTAAGVLIDPTFLAGIVVNADIAAPIGLDIMDTSLTTNGFTNNAQIMGLVGPGVKFSAPVDGSYSLTGGFTNNGQIFGADGGVVFLDGAQITGDFNNTAGSQIAGGFFGGNLFGSGVFFGPQTQVDGNLNNGGSIDGSGLLAGIGVTILSSQWDGDINNGPFSAATGDGSITGSGAIFGSGIAILSPDFQGNINNNDGLIQGFGGLGLGAGILGVTTGSYVGNVNNTVNGNIQGSGLLAGIGVGLFGTNISSTVTNAGEIQGTGLLFGAGVAMIGGNIDGGVNNSGVIQGTGLLSAGILTAGLNVDPFVIVNSGDITTNGVGILTAAGSFNGSIDNSGDINADIGGIVSLAGNWLGPITNSGTITTLGTGILGVAGTWSGDVANTGTGVISALVGPGIGLIAGTLGDANDGTDITNAGTIDATLPGVLVVAGTHFGDITNAATGVITSDTAGIFSAVGTRTGDITNNGDVVAGAIGVVATAVTWDGNFTNTDLITGGNSTGVLLLADTWNGHFENTATGVITGADTGVAIVVGSNFTGASPIFTNAGTLSGSDTGAFIAVGGNATGDVLNSGNISGENFGLAVQIGDLLQGNVDNQATGRIEAGSGVGLLVAADTIDGNINNSGFIGAVNGVGTLVSFDDWFGNFTNSGTIDPAVGSAVLITGGDWLGNFTNTGSILSGDRGVYYASGTQVGHFINEAGARITGNDDAAVEIEDGVVIDGNFINRGLIDGGLQDGVEIDGRVTGPIDNAGTIVGSKRNGGTDSAIDLTEADDQHVVINRDGAWILGVNNNGAIGFAYQGTNGFADTIRAEGGGINGNVIGAQDTLLVDAGLGLGFGDAGFFTHVRGQVSVDAIDVVTGMGVFGDVDPQDILHVSGQGSVLVANRFTVADNATAFFDDSTSGTFGRLFAAPGSTLGFEVGPNDFDAATCLATTAVSSVPCANNKGLLDATDQYAFITTATGAINQSHALLAIDGLKFLSLGAADYYYEDVIQDQSNATDNLIGRHATVLTTSPLFATATASYHFVDEAVNANPENVFYDNVDYQLQVRSFANPVGGLLTQNQTSVATAFDTIVQNPVVTPLTPQFFTLLNAVPGIQTLPEYQAVLDELHGSQHAQMQQVAIDVAGDWHTGVTDRMNNARHAQAGTHYRNAAVSSDLKVASLDYAAALSGVGAASSSLGASKGGDDGFALWGRGFGTWGNNDGDEEATGFDRNTYGLMAGVDFTVNPHFLIGFAGLWSETDVDFDRLGENGDVETWQAGAFLTHGWGNFYTDLAASFAWSDVEVNRNINIGFNTPFGPYAFNAGVWSTYSQSVITVSGEIGSIWSWGNVEFQPFLNLLYRDASADDFAEAGAGDFNLVVTNADADSLQTALGFRVNSKFDIGDMKILPEAKLAWVHEFMDERQEFTAHFAPYQTVPMQIVGADVGTDAALVGVGFTGVIDEGLEIYGGYNGLFMDGANSHGLQITIKKNF